MATITNPDLYAFEIISANHLNDHADTVQRIENGDLTGVILEGLFAPDFCESVVERLQRAVQAEPGNRLYYPAPFGHVFGTTLMENDLGAYLQRAAITDGIVEACFQQRYKATIFSFLARLGKGRDFVPAIHTDGQPFAMSGVRILEGGREPLEAHIHQEFPLHFPSYQGVTRQLDLATELSYYLVLQAPDEGGDLVLYDLNWENTPQDFLDSSAFMSKVRADRLESADRMQLRLQAGDAILFAANRVWHRVEPVAATSKARITVGGFLAKARENNDYGLFI